ncbi:hypothetical protein Tco_0581679 [Tanacetum coccineum]
MKCQPLNFKGTERVVELIQWFEKMEIVFSISNYFVENQIKFSTCTLLAGALMWWNSYVGTVGHDVAYAMTWTDLKKKMTYKYCPRGEIKKLEGEMWNLKVKESDKVERYVCGLPDMIHESVVASKPKTMQEVIEIATELMDKKIRTFVERQTENKRKKDNNQQQQPIKQEAEHWQGLCCMDWSPTNANTTNQLKALDQGQKRLLAMNVVTQWTFIKRNVQNRKQQQSKKPQQKCQCSRESEVRKAMQRTNPDSNVVTGSNVPSKQRTTFLSYSILGADRFCVYCIIAPKF